MKKTIALLLLVLPLFTVAQITFQPGYFIQNGAKTECLIKNQAWKNNPTSIEYKLNEGDETKIKNILEISEFSVDNSYKFRRFTVNIDRSESVLDRLDATKEPLWKKETLMLKVLVEGKITLYQYEEMNLVRYFFSTGDNATAEQLVYKEYRIQGYILENAAFRQQLYNLMKDTTTDIRKFETIKYKKDPLVKLFVTYNGTNGLKTVNLSEKQNKASINLKITPGITFTSASISNTPTETEYDFSNKVGFRIGAELECILPFNNNKWALFIDPNYQSYTDEGSATGITASIDYKYIQLPLGARYYMYLNPKSKFYAEALYSMSLAISDSHITYRHANHNGGTQLDIANFSGVSAGAGFSYDRYSAGVRYTTNHGLLNGYLAWHSDYSSVSVIFGYKLF